MKKGLVAFTALSLLLLGVGCYCESSDEIIAKYHQEHPMNPTRDSLVGFWKKYQDASPYGYGAKYYLMKKTESNTLAIPRPISSAVMIIGTPKMENCIIQEPILKKVYLVAISC